MKLVKKTLFSLLPLCFWLMVMLSFDNVSICALTILSAFLHELGHIFAYILVRGEHISSPRAVFFGLKLYTGTDLSYREELIVTLWGPLVNLLVFLICIPLSTRSEYIYTLGIINLFTALSNLFPINGYDGYGILRALILLRRDTSTLPALELVSLLFSSLITIISSLAIFIIGEGYWIFIVFFVHLFREILKLHC